jgi:hypothetical protein
MHLPFGSPVIHQPAWFKWLHKLPVDSCLHRDMQEHYYKNIKDRASECVYMLGWWPVCFLIHCMGDAWTSWSAGWCWCVRVRDVIHNKGWSELYDEEKAGIQGYTTLYDMGEVYKIGLHMNMLHVCRCPGGTMFEFCCTIDTKQVTQYDLYYIHMLLH